MNCPFSISEDFDLEKSDKEIASNLLKNEQMKIKDVLLLRKDWSINYLLIQSIPLIQKCHM